MPPSRRHRLGEPDGRLAVAALVEQGEAGGPGGLGAAGGALDDEHRGLVEPADEPGEHRGQRLLAHVVGRVGEDQAPRCGWHALDEEGWAALARQQAAAGIASTVSLPVVHRDRVVLGIDLYACTPHAFDDRLEDLARSLGAWRDGAVTNADLAFESRRRAEEAPQRLKERRTVEVAVGLLAARQGLDVESARALLRACAHRAGIRDVQAALVLLAIPDR